MKQIVVWLLVISGHLWAQRFTPTELANDLKGGYQVLAVDLTLDGREDLIALAQGMTRLDWFENPGKEGVAWPRHTIASGLNQPINVAAMDVDGDRVPELLLAHEFSNVPNRLRGLVSIFRHTGNVREPWRRAEVDAIPTSHRLRVANGMFVNAPLADPKSAPPEYRGRIPLTGYGKDLKPVLLSDEDSGVMHGIFVTDWDGDGREDILTASFNGLHVLLAQADGRYRRQLLHVGNSSAWPKGGSSDVCTVKAGGKRFLATIDPWHGNEFAMYTPMAGGRFERKVLDASIVEGHTVLAVDVDGDGDQEVVYGSRKEGGTLRLARWDRKAKEWNLETILDGKIGTASCAALDFNQDGRVDLACIGGASQNLMLFENRSSR